MRRKLPTRLATVHRAVRHDVANLTPLRIVEGIIVLVVLVQIAVISMNVLNQDTPVAGLRFEGQMIGRLGNQDFKKQVDKVLLERENMPVPVKVADVSSTISLRQLGSSINKQEVYEKILSTGRTGDVLEMMYYQNRAVLGVENITLEKTDLNKRLAGAYIAALNKKIAISPTNAHYVFAKQAAIQPDKIGRTISGNAALDLLGRVNPKQHTQIILPTKKVPAAITTSMLVPYLPQVKAITAKPLIVIAGSHRISLSEKELVSLIAPKIVTDSQTGEKVVRLTFNEKRIKAYLDKLLAKAVKSPTPTVMSGGVVVQQGENGMSANERDSIVRTLTALTRRQTGISMPGQVIIPLRAVAPPTIEQVVSAPAVINRTGTGGVHLTFDDGPGGYTEQVLDILSRYNVKATFYVIGQNVSGSPGTMQRIKNEGHAIGNHSFSHANLALLSAAGVHQELVSTQQVIQQTTGVTPTAFRPPYGSLSGTVASVAGGLGLSVDLWSVDPYDWTQPGSGVITQRVLSTIGPGAVVLLHSTNQQTVDALPAIIEGIRAQGYTL